MKTTLNFKNVKRKWYVVDAKGKTLGHLAVGVTRKLTGKDAVDYTPGVDSGNFIIILNASKIEVTGDKAKSKIYYRHSGYKGNMRETSLGQKLMTRPLDPLRLAISGMLPKNKLRKRYMMRLKLYEGAEHDHEAQKPEILEL